MRSLVDLSLYLGSAGLSVAVAASLRATVERLEVAQERLVAALEASGTGTWRWDLRTKQVAWDPALVHLFGLEPDAAPRSEADFMRMIHPDDRAHVRRVVDEAFAKGVAEYEFRAIRPDGTIRWMDARSRMIRDGKGASTPLMIGACLDVTERKLAQERQALLIHELNHRVKNTLAVVQSLALQTLRNSPTLAAFREAFQARLLALSATHNILTQELWESASMREILCAELNPFGGVDGQRVSLTGEPVRLTPRQALGFGMAFHELATNAAKYGALSSQIGSVAIDWQVTNEDGCPHVVVDWTERDGPVVQEPERKGFGSRLIERSICAELDGALTMRFDPGGLRCSFSVPL
nr:sensor histidine kinase [Microvirga antarctica]